MVSKGTVAMRYLSIFLLLSTLLLLNTLPGVAQDDAACPVLDETVLGLALETCADIEAGQGCAAGGLVTALADIETLVADETNPVQIVSLNAGLPDEAESVVSLILFGNATMTNAVALTDSPPVTLPVRNTAGYAVNMRQGPGTNHVVSGTMDRNFEGVVDGRDASGEWLRVQTEESIQWVAGRLVTVAGDINTLTVTDSPYSESMQAFTLMNTNDCDASGLWVQLSGQDTAKMQINGIDLSFSTATLLIKAAPNEKIEFIVLDGEVEARAVATTINASAGEQFDVALGGDDGLTGIEAPLLIDRYSFTSVATIPASLLPESTVCVAGVNLDDALMTIRAGPSDEYSALFDLDAMSHYAVEGQVDDWWKLSIPGYYEAWIPQAAVRTAGRCGGVEVVDAPPLFTPADPGGGMSLVPAGQSVWMAHSGSDVMTGTCTGNPMALCDHPVAINTLGGGSISWRGQEATAYTLTEIDTNTYVYNQQFSF
jgi:hypothetical protein